MTYTDKAEVTREFYRAQGVERERKRILQLLDDLEGYHKGSSWSPAYIRSLIEKPSVKE